MAKQFFDVNAKKNENWPISKCYTKIQKKLFNIICHYDQPIGRSGILGSYWVRRIISRSSFRLKNLEFVQSIMHIVYQLWFLCSFSFGWWFVTKVKFLQFSNIDKRMVKNQFKVFDGDFSFCCMLVNFLINVEINRNANIRTMWPRKWKWTLVTCLTKGSIIRIA